MNQSNSRLIVGLLLLSVLAVPAAAAPLSIVGDPTFDPATLEGEMAIWYGRMIESIEASRDTADGRSTSGDLYTLGRHLNNYTAALILALRATGDLQFLDRAAELWDFARADLADAWCDGTTDGYLNWLWLINADVTDDYCKDLHPMDEAMTVGAVAHIAHALDKNRHLRPEYAEQADFWRDYLENHFIAKWNERAGDPVTAWENGSVGFYKRFTHPRANQLRAAYYMWRLTDDSFYLQRATAIKDQLEGHMETNPTESSAYQWLHNVSGGNEGYQKVNYARYFMTAVLEMNLEQFGSYATDETMAKYMSTFRDVVFGKFESPWSSMANRVDGNEQTSTVVGIMSGFARWDATHAILDVAEADYSAGSSGVVTAGGALAALSQRGGDGGTSAPATPGNLRRTDVE